MKTSLTRKSHIGIFFSPVESHTGEPPLNSSGHIGQTNFKRIPALAFTVDLNGNRSSMTDPTGTQLYEYDALNRLTKITNPFGEVTTFQYDAIGRRIGMTQHNGVVTTYSYDDASRLLSLVSQIGATNISTFSYTYDNVGNRNSMIDNDGSHNYVYDQLYRLVTATHPQPTNPVENFNYDSVGNRTDSHISTTYLVDNMNRLVEGENHIYTYDNNGNTTQKESKGTGEVDVYLYDSEDKLINYEKYSSIISAIPTTQATYNYDGMGRRIAKTVDGVLTKFIYDGKDILLDLNSNEQVMARYTRLLKIDDVVSVNRDTTEDGMLDTLYYYHKDALGSVAVITEISGVGVENYTYDSFGRIIGSTNLVENRYTYTEREFDKESALYYYRARYYDPVIGRFLSEDPSHFPKQKNQEIPYLLLSLVSTPKEYNNYIYTLNNPLTFTDPLGLYNFFGGNPQTPGCDMFPDFNKCATNCCNEHDKCFERNGCNALTWSYTGAATAALSGCARCNLSAVKCLIGALLDCNDC